MAPASLHGFLAKRQNNYNNGNGNNNAYCDYWGCYSTWDSWGRWVALVVIVIAILLLAFLFSCYNNRRRRARGAPPIYGTGWIPYGKPPPGHNQALYDQHAAPPPPYVGTQATGTTFNSNEGYYGHHNDIELQQPESSYMPQRGGDAVYEAPLGPPPKKGDGIIR